MQQWLPLLTHGFYPVAESADGSELLLQDRTEVAQDADSPTLLVTAETAFRELPRLIGMSTTEAQLLIRSVGRAHSDSLRELLIARQQTASGLPVSFPAASAAPPAFDWSSWLTPEPGPDEPATPVNQPEPGRDALSEHLARIRAKFDWLRLNDPACLTFGSEWHRHRLNPPLLEAERAAFEQAEKVRLPTAFAGFLSVVGNGGAGPTEGLWRVEQSGARWVQWLQSETQAEARLSRQFPWRSVWDPPVPSEDDHTELEEYHALAHVAGTVFLAPRDAPEHTRDWWLLVVTGPERGHVWMDCRRSGRGIRPVFRRGPYSFLAWLEAGLDGSIADVPPMYTQQRQTGHVRT
jgi:hypothetical protein